MSGGLTVEMKDVRLALDGFGASFDARLEAGTVTALVGASGSGKSTFLNLIAGFDRPDSGHILIGGADMTARDPAQRPVSMVFQENNLFGHLDIAANVGLGRSPSLHLTPADRAAITQALERTGLAGKEARKPAELSGGERQRAALARVLVRDRPVLLLDEPFASLGPALRAGMLDLLTGLQRETGMTLVMVTHHPEDAVALGGQAIFLENGRITAQGLASDLFGPEGPQAVRRYTGGR